MHTCVARPGFCFVLAFLALAVLVGLTAAVLADPFAPDPVEELRRVLRQPERDPEARRKALTRSAANLRTLGQLRRALSLDQGEWLDVGSIDDTDRLAAVDRQVREELIQRFGEQLRRVLQASDATSRRAAVDLLAEMGTKVRGPGAGRGGLARDFTQDLAATVRRDTGEVRAAAARALGRIHADPQMAVPTLAWLLTNGDDPGRLAAAEGLADMVQTVEKLINQGKTSITLGLNPEDLVPVGVAVAPAAAQGLTDAVPAVRRAAADGLRQVAASVARQIPDPRSLDDTGSGMAADERRNVEELRLAFQPLLRVLRDQSPALARALADSDPLVRLRAARTLEEMSLIRRRYRRYVDSLTGETGEKPPSGDQDDLLLQGLKQAVPALAGVLSDTVVQNRLAALDALEWLGPEAAAAAPALIRAVGDTDRFVRWAAARTLGRAGPVDAAAVPALARLLDDADLDLRRAAAQALQNYGAVAAPAIPALLQALGAKDAELRVAAIKALEGIGTTAAVAIPVLAGLLNDPDDRVQLAAAELLGRFGPAAAAATEALRQALNDTNSGVRQAAADALLSINGPPGR